MKLLIVLTVFLVFVYVSVHVQLFNPFRTTVFSNTHVKNMYNLRLSTDKSGISTDLETYTPELPGKYGRNIYVISSKCIGCTHCTCTLHMYMYSYVWQFTVLNLMNV